MVRHKNRYIIAEYKFTYDEKQALSKPKVLQMVEEEIEKLHGDYGIAATKDGLDIKYFNPHTCMLIIRARHGPHKLVAATIAAMKSPVLFNIIRTTATIWHGFKAIKVYQLKKLASNWDRLKEFGKDLSEEDKKFLENHKNVKFFNQLNAVRS